VEKTRDLIGLTPLHYAMRYSEGQGVLELVEYIYNLYPEAVTTTDRLGNLPIHERLDDEKLKKID
jgi:hypothetical protein